MRGGMMRGVYVAVCVMMIMISSFCPAQCEEVRSMSGDIEAVDTFNSSINVRWLQDYRMLRYDDMSFAVTKQTRITRGGSAISLHSLCVGDHVTVEYRRTELSGTQAVAIIARN